MAFVTEFTVGDPGVPANGDVSYYNSLLAGGSTKTFRVFREGQLQYASGDNRVQNTGTGTIFFIPALKTPERIKIII